MDNLVEQLRDAIDAIPWLGPPDPRPYARLARLTLKASCQSRGELKTVLNLAANRAIKMESHALMHAKFDRYPAYGPARAHDRYAYEREWMLGFLCLPDVIEPLVAANR